jgi:hypothetical protein
MKRNWLFHLKALLPPTARRTVNVVRPGVQKLEGRDVPSLVVNANDTGTGSLRQAVIAANNTAGADTITFLASAFPAGTPIRLTSGPIVINDSVTITGPGVLNAVIDGSLNGGRLFTVDSAAPGNDGLPSGNMAGTLINVSFSGLTLTNATTADPNGGAAILDNGENVTLTQVEVDTNTATAAAAVGGAVEVRTPAGGSVGSLTVSQSAFVGNSQTGGSGSGGAVHVTGANALTVTNSTFDGSRAIGGISVGGAVALGTSGAVSLRFNTIANNDAPFGGGGVYQSSGSATLTGNVIANNTAILPGGDLRVFGTLDPTSSFNDVGVAAGATGPLAFNGNRSVDPDLGALLQQANGTKARVPRGVNVVDQVPAGIAPAADQAGATRPGGIAADIGAIEVGAPVGGTPGSPGGTPAPGTTHHRDRLRNHHRGRLHHKRHGQPLPGGGRDGPPAPVGGRGHVRPEEGEELPGRQPGSEELLRG